MLVSSYLLVDRQFCTRGCEDRTSALEADESEAVARERLLKTL
jgi:hypothetical protein